MSKLEGIEDWYNIQTTKKITKVELLDRQWNPDTKQYNYTLIDRDNFWLSDSTITVCLFFEDNTEHLLTFDICAWEGNYGMSVVDYQELLAND